MSETTSSAKLQQEVELLREEANTYKHNYLKLLEAYKKLEAGLVGQKRERHISSDSQLVLDVMSLALPAAMKKNEEAETTTVEKHERAKPSGRKTISDKLPRIEIEVLPLEVQQQGLNAFDRIGEDVSEVIEKRPASVVVARIVRPKFISKEKFDALKVGERLPVLQHTALELPIPRGLAGPGLLSDSIVKRFCDHQPLHGMERSYGREGLDINRSTMCGWHEAIAALAAPLVNAMWNDAIKNAPYLCTDATGVLVQDIEKCRRAHFFVVVAPERHVLFGFTAKHDAKAVDEILGDYKGKLVADAHAIYNHLYESGDVVECGCWAHTRRYFFKALETDKARSEFALNIIQTFFRFEKQWAGASPAQRNDARQKELRPAITAFFEWCDSEALSVLDATPISKAINYARNQREALQTFLTDGRIPIHNNVSERNLRRQAVGRKNWLFVGSDDGGKTNATLVSILASCEMHKIEPFAYLRDLLCLLPDWNSAKVIELAPANWMSTSARPEVVHALSSNPFRKISVSER